MLGKHWHTYRTDYEAEATQLRRLAQSKGLDTIAQALDCTHGCWVTDRPDLHPESTYQLDTSQARAALEVVSALVDAAADLVHQESLFGPRAIAGPLETIRHWCYEHHPDWAGRT